MTEYPAAPQYGGESLAAVLPSAAAALAVPGFWDLLQLGEGYRHVIVVLIDGLGRSALRDHASIAPFMTGADVRTIHAATPTTTPTGLATLGTGLPPGTHGLVGASFMVDGHRGLLHPLQWQEDPSPRAVQPEATILEQLSDRGVRVTSIGPRAYERSGLTRSALRGGVYRGADSLGERLGELLEVSLDPQPALSYVYWPDLDRTGHAHGVDSAHWAGELAHVDYLVERIADRCSSDELLVITSDHGMVDVNHDKRIDIDDFPQLRHQVLNIGGEPRCRFVYTRRGHEEEVAQVWRTALEEYAWVMTRSEAIAAGYFGSMDSAITDRVGGVIAWAKGEWSLTSPSVDSRVSNLRGQHGSLTAAEVEIPLIVVPGEGAGG
jgi:hypothetical protein